MTDMPTPDDRLRLYRAEAVEHYQRGQTTEGHLLEIEPRWTRYAYPLVLVLLLAAGLAVVWWVNRG